MSSNMLGYMAMHLLFLVLCLSHVLVTNSVLSVQPLCHEDERSALLQFKLSFSIEKFASDDPSAYPKMESWKIEGEHGNCCSWHGIKCDEITGHVIGLDISSSFIYGSIDSNSSLFRLVHLQRLNLAGNNFNYSEVPSAIGSLSRLTHLDLSHSKFSGDFPRGIFLLPNLQFLDVGQNPSLSGYLAEFHYKSPLKVLGLRSCCFSGTLPNSLGNLTQLTILDLSRNNISGYIPPFFANMSQLTALSLSENHFLPGPIPLALGQLAKLSYLDLGSCNLQGEIPMFLSNLTSLSYLNFYGNQLAKTIPSWLFNLTKLNWLEISRNHLHGPIPSSFYLLKHLGFLELSSNNFGGKVEMSVFLKLQNLYYLDLGSNKLTVLSEKITNNVTLPKINFLSLAECNIKKFPEFLEFQDELAILDLSHNQIQGLIPTWLWNSSKETMTLFGAINNLLTGFEKHPTVIPWQNLALLELHSNRLQGSLPLPPKFISVYDVAQNKLTGEIPPSIWGSKFLQLLDLSDNNLSGRIPPCLATTTTSLVVLNLSFNSFHGIIPEMFSMFTNLSLIDLSHNQLYGKVPRSMVNCMKLEVLNLGNNYIVDNFPAWLGTLPRLNVLVLQNNKFYGGIEDPAIHEEFSKLRIIDLSSNNFSGNLPLDNFRNWEAMKIVHKDDFGYMHGNLPLEMLAFNTFFEWNFSASYSIKIVNKGTDRNYEEIITTFVSIDLSSNRFKGQIPESFGNLKGIQSLNLSNNELDGPIPSSLGNLTELESLDLSRNLLSGKIPQQLTRNTFLAVFNVSYNNLTGVIPDGAQFDTFDNSSYEGNQGLCGKPLSKPCGSLKPSSPPPSSLQQVKNSKFLGTIDWVLRILGYGSGLIVGLVLGQALTTRNHYWFVKTFGRKQQRRKT